MSTMGPYEVGDTIKVDGVTTYTPSTVVFTVIKPDRTRATYDLDDEEVTVPTAGTYRLTITVDQPRTWRILINGAGPSGTPRKIERHHLVVRVPL